nr:LOB domain-containing protein 20-like [Ipomoea batatas]
MDTYSHGDGASSDIAPKHMSTEKQVASESVGVVVIKAPCGACKFLRRKCIPSCIFAPYFEYSDQGVTRFAAVHKVFGTSNASKILLRTPANRRHCAAITLSYEAQARLSDPIYGCVSTILALKQQVASLEAEIAMVKTEIMNSTFAVENGLQTSQQQEELTYFNTSSTAALNNDVLNISNFSSNFNLIVETIYADSQCFDPMVQLSCPFPAGGNEEQSYYPIAFTNQMFY